MCHSFGKVGVDMDWFTLTLLQSFISSSLILGLRFISPDTNPFAFMAIVTGAAAALLGVFAVSQGIDFAMPSSVLSIAALAGLSVAILDVAFIFMFRAGAKVSVSVPLFRVSAILISTIIGCSFFGETLTVMKGSGIACACLSIYFLTSSSSKGEA